MADHANHGPESAWKCLEVHEIRFVSEGKDWHHSDLEGFEETKVQN